MKQNRVGNSDELDENWNAQFLVSLNGEKLRACVCRCACVGGVQIAVCGYRNLIEQPSDRVADGPWAGRCECRGGGHWL